MEKLVVLWGRGIIKSDNKNMKRGYKFASVTLLSFLLYFCPNFAFADTVISSPITSDTTWSPLGGVYVIESGFSVASGTTLTIEPGTIIKSKITSIYSNPSIYGKIVARGSAELPIYFTSLTNDSLGGDTNLDGPSMGGPGEWQGLYFHPGSEGVFDYVELSFAGAGGYGWGNFSGIKNNGGDVEINNSNIHDNYANLFDWVIGNYRGGNSIYNLSGNLSINNSVIDSSASGIFVESGTTTITNTIIKNNAGYTAGYGINAHGEGSITLINNTFSNNTRTAQISLTKDFNHSGNTSNDTYDRGFKLYGEITKDTTWHSSDLPILIDSVITVPVGKTLTVKPGTIIKMGDVRGNGSIEVYGNLIAEGTADSKIYFTSKKDDSVGGDTNGDGDNTLPNKRDWFGMIFHPGSATDFKHTSMKYSGFNGNGEYLSGVAATIYNRGGEFSLEDSIISDSSVSIFQDLGTTTISKSELISSEYDVWSRGGSITISQSSLLGQVYGVYNQSGIDLGPWWQTKPLQIIEARNNWWRDPTGPRDVSTSTPTGNGSWVSENVLYTPFLTTPPSEEQIIDPVIIIPGIMGSAYKNGELVIDPILHTYDDLIATLVANGYEEGKDLFTFPYEWRDSNVLSANLLKDKLNQVKSICGCSKVDLVAHSMGGLVAREYIQSGQYQNDVDQLIFLGTPHKGSPRSYLIWEAGEFEQGSLNFFIKKFFQWEALKNGYLSLFDYVQERPIASVNELLPIVDYIKDKDTGILREYSENYPRNIFLESLEIDKIKLFNSGVRISNIVGNAGEETIETIRVVQSTGDKWLHGKPDGFDGDTIDRGLERGAGDDTVTIEGASLDDSFINTVVSAPHIMLPSYNSANIYEILTGETPTIIWESGIGPDPKAILLQLLSPVDFVVTAPDGKKIGKNFVNGEEYNQIPNAFYSGYQTEEEYITILNPLDGEYKIELQGTHNGGEYGVLTSYISEEFATTTETAGLTQPNQITNMTFEVDKDNPESIVVEKEVSVESVIIDINKAYDLGWITDKKVRDSLARQVKLIIKFEEKRNGKYEKKVDKIILKILEKELDLLLKKEKINQQAYNIIKDDLNWLVLNN